MWLLSWKKNYRCVCFQLWQGALCWKIQWELLSTRSLSKRGPRLILDHSFSDCTHIFPPHLKMSSNPISWCYHPPCFTVGVLHSVGGKSFSLNKTCSRLSKYLDNKTTNYSERCCHCGAVVWRITKHNGFVILKYTCYLFHYSMTHWPNPQLPMFTFDLQILVFFFLILMS